jgi:PrcB C-terminal
MKRRRIPHRIAPLAAVLLLAACAQVTPVAESVAQLPRKAIEGTADFFQWMFSRPDLAVDVTEVGRTQDCKSSGRESALTLLPDLAAVQAWQAQRGVTLASGALAEGRYAIAEMGERNTGGYSLSVSRQAATKDDVLYLRATYLVPANASQLTPNATAPCSLVLLPPNFYKAVVLLDQSNKPRDRVNLVP